MVFKLPKWLGHCLARLIDIMEGLFYFVVKALTGTYYVERCSSVIYYRKRRMILVYFFITFVDIVACHEPCSDWLDSRSGLPG